jgi:hypothetical protein
MTDRRAYWRIQPWMLRRLALFLGILLSGGILLIPRIPVLLLVIVLCLHGTGWRLPFRRALWPVFALLAAVLLLTLVRPGGPDLNSLAIRFANFAAALLLLNMYLRAAPGTLVRDLQAVLWPMAWQAILTVPLAMFASFLFVPLDFSETQYRTLLLVFTYHITIEDAGGLVRPDGFFFEPGVFQIYLNLYLFLMLFHARNLRRAGVGLVAVLSTQSTTGLLICILLVCAAIMQHIRTGSTLRQLTVLLTAAVITPALLTLGYDNVHEKLFGTLQGSSWARQYDLITGLNILGEHPLLGIGFDADRYIASAQVLGYEDTQLSPEGLEERSTSNGLLQLFVSLGVPLGLAFLVGVVRQRVFGHRWLITLWFMLSMVGEALVFTPFFLLVAFSAYVAVRAPRPRRQAVVTRAAGSP